MTGLRVVGVVGRYWILKVEWAEALKRVHVPRKAGAKEKKGTAKAKARVKVPSVDSRVRTAKRHLQSLEMWNERSWAEARTLLTLEGAPLRTFKEKSAILGWPIDADARNSLLLVELMFVLPGGSS